MASDIRLNPSVDAREAPRLSRQCLAILDRLRLGRVSNDELSRIARKYTGRISEIRQAGYPVEVVERHWDTGLVWYALRPQGPPSQGELF